MIEPRRMVAASDAARSVPLARLLFLVLGPPVIWALHLSAVYLLVTLDCLTAWDGGLWTVLAVTVAAIAGSGAAGWLAWRAWRRGDRDPWTRQWPHFLVAVGLAGGVLFTLVILATGVVPLLVPLCAEPDHVSVFSFSSSLRLQSRPRPAQAVPGYPGETRGQRIRPRTENRKRGPGRSAAG